MTTPTPELTDTMRRVGELLAAGNYAQARVELVAVSAQHPDYVEGLRLLGGTEQALGDAAAAEQLLRRALALDPNWVPTLTTFGELLLATGRGREAEQYLKRAMQGPPPYPHAALLLARYYNEVRRHAEALNAATPFVLAGKAGPDLVAQHVSALAALGRVGEAVSGYRQITAKLPNSASAAQGLAMALNLTGEHAEAERVAEAALAGGARSAALLSTYARSLIAQGSGGERAETALRECLALEPHLIEVHSVLAQLVWLRTGDLGQATATLDESLGRFPNDEALWAAKAAILQGAGDARAAYACLEPWVSRAAAPPTLLVRGGLAALEFEPATAVTLAERALRLAPGNSPARTLLAAARLGTGEPAAALAECAPLLQATPDDQYLIALQTTAWRMQGDERYQRLCDYRSLVVPQQLEPPAPWTDLETFLADLRVSLNRLHDPHGHALLFQSLRNGTETTQDLSRSTDPAIRGLFSAFVAPVQRYLAKIGQGTDPLRRRNNGRWRFNGAWSVRLHRAGFHANHTHPRGWISSACYLELPEVMGSAGTDQGVLRFAQPGIRTLPPLEAQHSVHPAVGMLVLFPSYFWHGTVPFESDQPRLTVAFDAVPAS